ncbi:hypothetical protein GMMP1_1260004 [Candidatus Magnetomoraceae bacterium gMMP-1]
MLNFDFLGMKIAFHRYRKKKIHFLVWNYILEATPQIPLAL